MKKTSEFVFLERGWRIVNTQHISGIGAIKCVPSWLPTFYSCQHSFGELPFMYISFFN